MKLLKIQTAIMAIMLVTIPLLGIQDANAFTPWKITTGTHISLERQAVVAKGDKVLIDAKFFDNKDADSYNWNWDICGKKSTVTTSTWYSSKNFTFKNVGNCVVKVDGQAIYEGQIIGGEPTDGVIVPGTVSDTINVLPSETVSVSIIGPSSATVGQVFWLSSNFDGDHSWRSTGACKGTSTSVSIGEKGDKIGTCTVTLNVRREYPDKVVKGVAVKNITIN